MTTRYDLPSLPYGSVARGARATRGPSARPLVSLTPPGVGIRVVRDAVTRLVGVAATGAPSVGTAYTPPAPRRSDRWHPAPVDAPATPFAALGVEVARVARDRARPGHPLDARRDIGVGKVGDLRSLAPVEATSRPAGRLDLVRSGRRGARRPPPIRLGPADIRRTCSSPGSPGGAPPGLASRLARWAVPPGGWMRRPRRRPSPAGRRDRGPVGLRDSPDRHGADRA